MARSMHRCLSRIGMCPSPDFMHFMNFCLSRVGMCPSPDFINFMNIMKSGDGHIPILDRDLCMLLVPSMPNIAPLASVTGPIADSKCPGQCPTGAVRV